MVYHARLLLRHVYRARNREEAEKRFAQLLELGSNPDMPSEAAKAIESLNDYRKQILAYFDVMWKHYDGRDRGPTTNHAEARNGKIKAMWKRSRGFRNAAYFTFRVVFEPYVLGATLILCDRCGGTEILSDTEGLRRAGMDVLDPDVGCCSACAAG